VQKRSPLAWLQPKVIQKFETIVAVNSHGEVVSPYGMCRELISGYSPEAKMITKENDKHKIVAIRELLPKKYKRT
jgi:cytidine deaminase